MAGNPVKLDIVGWPVVDAVVKQIRQTFADHGLPISRVVPQWSDLPVLDVGDDGCVMDQAWVRLVGQTPARVFPVVDASPVYGARSNPAAPGRLATTIEVGVVHCTGWQIDEHFIPSEEQYTADTERSFAEMSALRVAVCKAMVAQKREYQFMSFSPMNDGLSAGGAWQVAFDWIKGEH